MNSPHNSLATILDIQGGQVPPPPAGEEGDGAILMSYLREHYNPQDERYDDRYPPLPSTAPAPASPVDNSVPIPSSLQALATPAPNAPYLAPLPPMSEEFPGESVALDRGEMGGKRRKAPHERAGWKEIMEEEERMKTEANSGAAGSGGDEGQKEDEFGSKIKRAKLSKESRAEQNRKAQQVFRRKREEKMKQLEIDAMALQGTRQRLAAAEERILALALNLEAKTIESAALREALTTAAARGSISLIRPDGGLVITPAEWEERDREAGPERVPAACEQLAKASRELAKANRERREAGRQ